MRPFFSQHYQTFVIEGQFIMSCNTPLRGSTNAVNNRLCYFPREMRYALLDRINFFKRTGICADIEKTVIIYGAQMNLRNFPSTNKSYSALGFYVYYWSISSIFTNVPIKPFFDQVTSFYMENTNEFMSESNAPQYFIKNNIIVPSLTGMVHSIQDVRDIISTYMPYLNSVIPGITANDVYEGVRDYFHSYFIKDSFYGFLNKSTKI